MEPDVLHNVRCSRQERQTATACTLVTTDRGSHDHGHATLRAGSSTSAARSRLTSRSTNHDELCVGIDAHGGKEGNLGEWEKYTWKILAY